MTPTATKGRRGTKPAARRYELTEKFFTETLRETQRDTLFLDLEFSEKEVVRLKPDFDTACWAFLPPHRIYVGLDLFEKRVVKKELPEELQKKYIGNHYHHERGHAAFTERNMKRVNEALASITAPFSLFNLFEDAWMEEKYRKASGYKFEWLTMEDLDFMPRPESLLFALIQAEGDVEVVEEGLKAWKPLPPDKDDPMAVFAAFFAPSPEETREALLEKLPRVVEYYQRILASRDSMAHMPVLNAWLDEFGRPPQPPGGGEGGGGGGMADLELSAQLMMNPAQAEEFDADAKDVRHEDLDDEDRGGPPKKAQADSVRDLPEAKQGQVLTKGANLPVDMDHARRMGEKLKRFFQAVTTRISTRTPQKKFSARHAVLGRPAFRKMFVKGRGKKKILLVVDLSGSMSGHIDDGKVLIAALSMLAQQNMLEGHVAFSGVTGRGPSWETYKLPMSPATLSDVQAKYGAEGLEYTLRGNLDLAREADYVFVYTDAQICDKPIEKSFFHKYGIFTWGLYCGTNESFLDELFKYFDKAIMRQTVDDLIDAMLAQNK